MSSDLGNRIRTLREAKRWTQEDLAGSVGVSLRTVGNWERTGRVPTDRFADLIEALGGDPRDGLVAEDAVRPEPIEIVYQGMRFVIHPRPGATPAEVRTQSREIIDAVLQRLEQLDAEAAARED